MKRKTIAAIFLTFLGLQGAHAQESVGNFLTGVAKVGAVVHAVDFANIPKPDVVLVDKFTMQDGSVTMDDSTAARLRRHRMHLFSTPDDLTPEMLSQKVQSAFTQGLSDELKKVQITTANATEPREDSSRSSLVIDSELLAIDEGNESKRIMIGLGKGASDVKLHIVVSSVSAGRSSVVLAFDVHAASGKKPGALMTMGGGSLAVGAAEKAVGNHKSTVEQDASRIGKLVALQIEAAMSGQTRIASQ